MSAQPFPEPRPTDQEAAPRQLTAEERNKLIRESQKRLAGVNRLLEER